MTVLGDGFEESSRRFKLLLEGVPELDAPTMWEFAQSNIPDSELFTQASAAVDMLAIRQAANALGKESKPYQRATWNKMTDVQRTMYTKAGYQPVADEDNGWLGSGWGAFTGAVSDAWNWSKADKVWKQTGGRVFDAGLWMMNKYTWVQDQMVNRPFRLMVDLQGQSQVKRINAAMERARSVLESEGIQLNEDQWNWLKWQYGEINKIERVQIGSDNLDPNVAVGATTALQKGLTGFNPGTAQASGLLAWADDTFNVIDWAPDQLEGVLGFFSGGRKTDKNPNSSENTKAVGDDIYNKFASAVDTIKKGFDYDLSFAGAWNRSANGHSYVSPDVAGKVQSELRELGYSGKAYDMAVYFARGNNIDAWLQNIEQIDPTTNEAEYKERYKVLATYTDDEAFQNAVKDLSRDQSKISVGRIYAKTLGLPEDSPVFTMVSGSADMAALMILDPIIIAGKGFKTARFIQNAVGLSDLPALRKLSNVVRVADKAEDAASMVGKANETLRAGMTEFKVFTRGEDVAQNVVSRNLLKQIIEGKTLGGTANKLSATATKSIQDSFDRIFGFNTDIDEIFKFIDDTGSLANVDFYDEAAQFVKEAEAIIISNVDNGILEADVLALGAIENMKNTLARIPAGAFELKARSRFVDTLRVRQVRKLNRWIDTVTEGFTKINANVENASYDLLKAMPNGGDAIFDALKAENDRLLALTGNTRGLTDPDAVWNFLEANFLTIGNSRAVSMSTKGFGTTLAAPNKWRLFNTHDIDMLRTVRQNVTGVTDKVTTSSFGRLPTLSRGQQIWRSTANFTERTLDAIQRLKKIQSGPAAAKLGVRIASKPLRVAAALVWNLGHHVPRNSVLSLMGDDAIKNFEHLVNYGHFGGMDLATRKKYIDAFLRGVDTGDSWFVLLDKDNMVKKAEGLVNKTQSGADNIWKAVNTNNEVDNLIADLISYADNAELKRLFAGGGVESEWNKVGQNLFDRAKETLQSLETKNYGKKLADWDVADKNAYEIIAGFQKFDPGASSLAGRMYLERQFLEALFHNLGITASKDASSAVSRFLDGLSYARYAPANADIIGTGSSAYRAALLPVAQHSTQMAIPTVREVWRAGRHLSLLSKFLKVSVNTTFVDAAMSRFWKPLTLMRLSFIPRAAGEEYLAFFAREGMWAPVASIAAYAAGDHQIMGPLGKMFMGALQGVRTKSGRFEWGNIKKAQRALRNLSKEEWGRLGADGFTDDVWQLSNALQYGSVKDYVARNALMVSQITGRELNFFDYRALTANWWASRAIRQIKRVNFKLLPQEFKRSVIAQNKTLGKEKFVNLLGYDEIYDVAVGINGATDAMARNPYFQQVMADNMASLGRNVIELPYEGGLDTVRISARQNGFNPDSGVEILVRQGHEWIELTEEAIVKANPEQLAYWYQLLSNEPTLNDAFDTLAGRLTETEFLDGVRPVLDDSRWASTYVDDPLPLVDDGVPHHLSSVEPVHDPYDLIKAPNVQSRVNAISLDDPEFLIEAKQEGSIDLIDETLTLAKTARTNYPGFEDFIPSIKDVEDYGNAARNIGIGNPINAEQIVYDGTSIGIKDIGPPTNVGSNEVQNLVQARVRKLHDRIESVTSATNRADALKAAGKSEEELLWHMENLVSPRMVEERASFVDSIRDQVDELRSGQTAELGAPYSVETLLQEKWAIDEYNALVSEEAKLLYEYRYLSPGSGDDELIQAYIDLDKFETLGSKQYLDQVSTQYGKQTVFQRTVDQYFPELNWVGPSSSVEADVARIMQQIKDNQAASFFDSIWFMQSPIEKNMEEQVVANLAQAGKQAQVDGWENNLDILGNLIDGISKNDIDVLLNDIIIGARGTYFRIFEETLSDAIKQGVRTLGRGDFSWAGDSSIDTFEKFFDLIRTQLGQELQQQSSIMKSVVVLSDGDIEKAIERTVQQILDSKGTVSVIEVLPNEMSSVIAERQAVLKDVVERAKTYEVDPEALFTTRYETNPHSIQDLQLNQFSSKPYDPTKLELGPPFTDPPQDFPNQLYRAINSLDQWYVDSSGNLHMRANVWGGSAGRSISTSTDYGFIADWVLNNPSDQAFIFVFDVDQVGHLRRGKGLAPNEIELISTNGETVIPAGAWKVQPQQNSNALLAEPVSREGAVRDLRNIAAGGNPADSIYWNPERLNPEQQLYLTNVQQRGYADFPAPVEQVRATRRSYKVDDIKTKAEELRRYIASWSDEDKEFLHRFLQNDVSYGFSSPKVKMGPDLKATRTMDQIFEDANFDPSTLPQHMQDLLDRVAPGSAFYDLLESAVKLNAKGDPRMLEALDVLTRSSKKIGHVLAGDTPLEVLDRVATRTAMLDSIQKNLVDPNFSWWVRGNVRSQINSRTGVTGLRPVADNTENLFTIEANDAWHSIFRKAFDPTIGLEPKQNIEDILNVLRTEQGLSEDDINVTRIILQGIDETLRAGTKNAVNQFASPISTVYSRDGEQLKRISNALEQWFGTAPQRGPHLSRESKYIDISRITVPTTVKDDFGRVISDPAFVDYAGHPSLVIAQDDTMVSKLRPVQRDSEYVGFSSSNAEKDMMSNLEAHAELLVDEMERALFAKDGRVLHEIVEPIRRGTFGIDAMGTVDAADLPASLITPREFVVPTSPFDVLTSGFFGKIVNPAIFSIVRSPMYTLAFTRGYEFSRAQTLYMRNIPLDEAIVRIQRVTNLDPNEIRNAWSMLGEAAQESMSTAKDFDAAIATLIDEGKIDPQSILASEKFTDTELEDILNWARMDYNVESLNVKIAAQRALDDVTPYIDDHSIRSFFQEYARNIFPFEFAQEQFLKRWARGFVYSPESFRRAQLLTHGITNNALVHTDANGQDYIVIPMTESLMGVLGKIPVVKNLFGDAVNFPVTVPLGMKTRNILPGIPADIEHLPSMTPIAQIGASFILNHFPEAKGLASAFNAGYPIDTQKNLLESFVPANYLRMYVTLFGGYGIDAPMVQAELNRNAIAAISQMSAAAGRLRAEQQDLLKAGDEEGAKELQDQIDELELPETASEEQVTRWLDTVKDFTRANMFIGSAIGWFAPTRGTPIFEDKQLNREFTALLNHFSFDEAVEVFLMEHPEGAAFTVFDTAKDTKAPIPRTYESLNWMNENKEWLKNAPLAAPWFMPQLTAPDDYSAQANVDMLSSQMRRMKDVDEWYYDYKFAVGANAYFPEKLKYDVAIETASSSEKRSQLRKEWELVSKQIRLAHPLFAKQLEEKVTTDSERTIKEIELFLNLPDDELPDMDHIDGLRLAVESWRNYKTSYDSLAGKNTKEARDQRNELRYGFIDYGNQFLIEYPEMRIFWNAVILPSLELTSRAAALEKIGG